MGAAGLVFVARDFVTAVVIVLIDYAVMDPATEKEVEEVHWLEEELPTKVVSDAAAAEVTVSIGLGVETASGLCVTGVELTAGLLEIVTFAVAAAAVEIRGHLKSVVAAVVAVRAGLEA